MRTGSVWQKKKTHRMTTEPKKTTGTFAAEPERHRDSERLSLARLFHR
jgi:hypothetical protein